MARPHRARVVHLTTIDMSLAVLLLPQLTAFVRAGYEVIGVSAAGPDVARLETSGIRHIALRHATRSNSALRDSAAMAEFWRLCRRLRPDIVHTHTPKPGIYGRVAGRLAGVPVVVNTVHGLYAQPTDPALKRTVVYTLERLAASCSDGELVQSVEDLSVLRRLRVPDRKLHHLGNGIDLVRFDPGRDPRARARSRAELGIADDEVVVGLVGRLVHEKGYREAFAALRSLSSRVAGIRPVVIGPAEPEKADALTDEEFARARADGVLLLGNRADIETLYPAMDIYVLASHREGFPRSAMEAAALGLPVIATDIRGCREAVEDGVTGLLVPAGDVASLTDALEQLVIAPERRRRLGQAGRCKALRDFDDRRQIQQTLELYERLLANASATRRPGGDALAGTR